MSKLLSDFKALCHYDSATQKFIIDSEINGWLTATQSATIGAGGDPEGIEFAVKVYNASADFEGAVNDHWERMVATYSIDGSEVSFERVDTKASSTGGPITTFSDAPSSLVIYGVASPEDVVDIQTRLSNLESIPGTKILQRDVVIDSTDFINATTSLAALSVPLVITPVSGASVLIANVFGDYRIVGDLSSTTLRARLILQYKDGSGAWTDIGASYLLGHVNVEASSTTPQLYVPPSFTTKLSASNKNPDGDWELRVAGEVDFANSAIHSYHTGFDYTEI